MESSFLLILISTSFISELLLSVMIYLVIADELSVIKLRLNRYINK